MPTNNVMQHDELTHQIRRLSHHPSIVVCLFSNEYIHFISHILSIFQSYGTAVMNVMGEDYMIHS